MNIENRFEAWAVVELFGHTKIAGLVTEEEIGGGPMIRVDVPEVDGIAAFTRYFNQKAIYSITPVDEDTARTAVEAYQPKPVEVWRLRSVVGQLSAGNGDDSESEYTLPDNATRDRYTDDYEF